MIIANSRKYIGLTLAGFAGLAMAGCQDEGGLGGGRAYAPIPEQTMALMDQMGTTKYSPVLLRAFKKESELEVWKMKADGAYALLKTFPMCRWSGQLGPKRREGDRQVPEGFYYVTPKRMNPNSAYYLSFNVGYPNAYDRAHGRTGSQIMVHGACSSRGCFSMTDPQISEIYAIVREAFTGGQKAVQLQSLPFRMNAKNLAKHRLDKNMKFWKALKEGSDTLEVAKREPTVMVCNRQYVFNGKPVNPAAKVSAGGSCPPMQRDETLVAAIRKKDHQDETKVAALVSKGVHPVKIVYADGGQHQKFAHISIVSRPDALASAPVEIALDNHGKPLKEKPKKTQLATAKDGSKTSGQEINKNVAAKNDANAKPALVATGNGAKATGAKTPAAATNQIAGTTVKTKDAAGGVPATATAFAPANPAPANPASKPLLSRWFGGLTGNQAAPKTAPLPADPAANTAPAGQSVPANQTAPLPPSRKAVSAPPTKAKNDKSAAALPGIIRGSYSPLPAGLTAFAPIR